MYYIIYSSQAQEPMTLAKLVVLLMQARSCNERKGVTGALVYGAGQFMQVMEGEEAVVKDLYEHISKDVRHSNIRKLAEGPLATRSFARWSMAFGEVPTAEFQVLRRIGEYQTPTQMADQLAASGVADGHLLAKIEELIYTHAQD